MTTRNEPVVGLSKIFGSKAKSHSALADEALQAFTDAQTKLEVAQAAIQAQIEEDEKEVAIRQGKILGAQESHSRLERIKNRFADLLS
ncbi:hypothetical protein PHB09_084 [Pseudomonas phage PHB09]|uniref:PspA/IM30 family protein n=1 Tax=Pseudomonas phage PHB09 TaxID=2867265 RepID=A0AAE8XCU5_9CAUD|nr:hypothetical protein QGX10_gp084 [Pseudomonas phage PHB09]UAV84580.1 hypothetical protein PHB09_084 [Pseudomonas phage PHB09]